MIKIKPSQKRRDELLEVLINSDLWVSKNENGDLTLYIENERGWFIKFNKNGTWELE